MAGPPIRLLWCLFGIILLFYEEISPIHAVKTCEPRDCKWDPWLRWSRCNAQCDSLGKRSRIRFVRLESRCGGLACQGRGVEVKPCYRSCKDKRSLLDEFLKRLLHVKDDPAAARQTDTQRDLRAVKIVGSGDSDGSGEEKIGVGGSGEKEAGSGQVGIGGSGELGGSGEGEEITTQAVTTESTISSSPTPPQTITVETPATKINPSTAQSTQNPHTVSVEPPATRVKPSTAQTEPPQVSTTTAPEVPPSECPMSVDSEGNHVIGTDDPDWERSEFCEVFMSQSVTSNFYKVSADLYHDGGQRSNGELGLMYNVVDYKNFDYVTFSTSMYGPCLRYGYYTAGRLVSHNDWVFWCRHGCPSRRTWFSAAVYVSDTDWAYFTFDGYPVGEARPHYLPNGRGGVMAAKGLNTVARFHDYSVAKEPATHPLAHIQFYGCLSGSRDTYLAADPDHPGTFCHAVVSEVKAAAWYRVSVDLYNEAVWEEQNIPRSGVMYQLKDMNNYQVVTLEFHKDYVCLQGGEVSGGQYNILSSELCLSNPPRSDTWFHFNVKVTADGQVRAQLGNKEALTFKTDQAQLMPADDQQTRTGVAIANGHIGVLRFKNFKVETFADGVAKIMSRNEIGGSEDDAVENIMRLIRKLHLED